MKYLLWNYTVKNDKLFFIIQLKECNSNIDENWSYKDMNNTQKIKK